MQLKRKRGNLSLFVYIVAFTYIIGIMDNLRKSGYIDNTSLIAMVISPGIIVVVIIIMSLKHMFNKKIQYYKTYVVLYTDKDIIWRGKTLSIMKEAIGDTLVVALGMSLYLWLNKGTRTGIHLIFFAGLSIWLQLIISYMIIELMEWLFNKRWIGMLVVTLISIGDAFAFLKPLLYRRLFISKEILYNNLGGIAAKLILSAIIIGIIYFAGNVYSKNKEFL